MTVKIGCCGWSYFKPNDFIKEDKDWKKIYDHKVQAYADFFDLVEVNSTFYKLPQIKTAEKWRELVDEVNGKFEFTVKCLRTVTHKDRFVSEKSVQAFNQTVEIAQALDAKIILLQSPPSFGPSKENIEHINNFFRSIDKDDFTLAWEPRGDWLSHPDKIAAICKRLGLTKCTDPFKMVPRTRAPIAYFRLHGKPPSDEMYKYDFKEEDLKKLKKRVNSLDSDDIYVLFNNYSMYTNAKQLEKIL